MAERTAIQWADVTWSPWSGCSKVGPGCDHCYAEEWANRAGRTFGKRVVMSDRYWRSMDRMNKQAGLGRFVECACGHREFRQWDDSLPPGGLACCSRRDCTALPETEAFRRRPRVFPSLCDWLDEQVPLEVFCRFMDTVACCQHVNWMLLSKRLHLWGRRLLACTQAPEAFASPGATMCGEWLSGRPPWHVALGVSAENQAAWDFRRKALAMVPAAATFVSFEPLLGMVRFQRGELRPPDLAIIGGESGVGARDCDAGWIDCLMGDLQSAGVRRFVKQLGTRSVMGQVVLQLEDPKGGNIDEWPRRFQVREVLPEDFRELGHLAGKEGGK